MTAVIVARRFRTTLAGAITLLDATTATLRASEAAIRNVYL
jgi:hypothetical protein